jgi:hypothetical protein
MHPPGKGAGTRSPGHRTGHKASFGLFAIIAMVAGCSVWIPTSTGRTTFTLPVGQGAVRHFPLKTGDVTLPLPASKNLVLMLAASSSVGAPVTFRVTGASGRLGGDARFSKAGADLAQHYGERTARRRVQAEQPIGATLEFWINRGDNLSTGDCHRLGTVRWKSAHAYYLLDSGPASTAAGCGPAPDLASMPTEDQLQDMAAAFEGNSAFPGASGIWNTVTQLFGADPAEGVDGDPRTYVVLSPAVDDWGKEKGLLGYFWSRDVDVSANHSNRKEVIFLTNQIFTQRRYTTYGTLAHEFTHLVMFYQRRNHGAPAADPWWDEALSMLAMDQTGYGLRAGNEDIAKDIRSFLQQPSAYSLTDWHLNPNQFAYGLVYVFARYLHDRFGPEFVRESLAARDSGGVAGLDRLLRRRGTTFQQVYADFMVAVYTSGTLLEVEPKYRMPQDINLRASYGAIGLDGVRASRLTAFGQQESASLRPWGTAFYDFGQEDDRAWNFTFRVPSPMFGSAVGW